HQIGGVNLQFVLAWSQSLGLNHLLDSDLLATLLEILPRLNFMRNGLLPLGHLEVQGHIVLMGFVIDLQVVKLKVNVERLINMKFGVKFGANLGGAQYKLPYAYVLGGN